MIDKIWQSGTSFMHWQSKEAQGEDVEQAPHSMHHALPKSREIGRRLFANADNKKELFFFLSKKKKVQMPDDNDVYITANDQIHHVRNSSPMG